MTPQERAAAFIKSTFPLHLREDGEPCDGDIEDVIAHDKQTRRAALLEVAELHQEWRNGKHSGTFSDLLRHKLAQEG